MGHYIREIRKNTAGMNRREKGEYILTYYWYHILGMIGAICLILFLIIHFGFREAPPLFTCALVNQEINFTRDEEIEKDFSAVSGIDEKRMEINSDFNIAYGDIEPEGINESSYENFSLNGRMESWTQLFCLKAFISTVRSWEELSGISKAGIQKDLLYIEIKELLQR